MLYTNIKLKKICWKNMTYWFKSLLHNVMWVLCKDVSIKLVHVLYIKYKNGYNNNGS